MVPDTTAESLLAFTRCKRVRAHSLPGSKRTQTDQIMGSTAADTTKKKDVKKKNSKKKRSLRLNMPNTKLLE
ncbi:hypothetical protein JZ751_008222 [Albula glossodonta]|uniref:Uncharacterized protein n=1 Tax=Albula glossodonta TaxID=121402 RepID=A0A8T2N367_9TELE|nr:hypothetical protein JZ751_008222 [Albula glossodonta]